MYPCGRSGKISFFKAQWYSTGCIGHIFFIDSYTHRHLGRFHLLGIKDNIAINTVVQISLWAPAFSSFAYILRKGIAGSYGNSIFNCLRNCHAAFHSTAPFYTLTDGAQGFRFLHILPTACFCFFIVATLMGMRWYLTIVLICISLLIGDTEHLFICFLAICMSSVETCLFRAFLFVVFCILNFPRYLLAFILRSYWEQ